MPPPRWELFAATAPGLEPLALRELAALGLPATVEDGGVTFAGGMAEVATANLRLGTVSRVLVRLGTFKATRFDQVVRLGSALPFEQVMAARTPVAWKVTCRHSRLHHTVAVAQRLHAALQARLGAEVPQVKLGDDETPSAAQLMVVRLQDDQVTVSADASGALLHQRGWRLQAGSAPLRETLAAALLMHVGWEPGMTLWDPFCGSGTLVIEAAVRAAGLAPGHQRHFAYQRWPAAAGLRLPKASPAPVATGLWGSDSSHGVLLAAKANLERAGVQATLFRGVVPKVQPPTPGPGVLVANPPYGKRLADAGVMQDLAAWLHGSMRGWRVGVVVPPQMVAPLGLKVESVLNTRNGGLNVALVRGMVP